MKSPNEKPVQMDTILLNNFLQKGYRHTEIHEQDATIVILQHGKTAGTTGHRGSLDSGAEMYKIFLKA